MTVQAASAGAEGELLARARGLGGRTLAEIAIAAARPLPPDPRRHKGATGALIERALGADAGSRPIPDFPTLGIELKTLPIDARGEPAESTFVCCAPREREDGWEQSSVRAKLARVLFVPVETTPPFAQRRVGSAFLWSPEGEIDDILRADWDALSDLIERSPESISARHGRALQLRPKARDGAVLVRATDVDGAPLLAKPRAFYLRRTFVAHILRSQGLQSCRA